MRKSVVRKFQKNDAEDVVKIFKIYGLVLNEEERTKSLKYESDNVADHLRCFAPRRWSLLLPGNSVCP